MSEENQIHLPDSFIALYRTRSGKWREPIEHVRQRYELCEDLANHLVGHAQLQHHTEVPVEDEILRRIHAGLLAAESGVAADEAGWIVRRLAELLDWRAPEWPDSIDAG